MADKTNTQLAQDVEILGASGNRAEVTAGKRLTVDGSGVTQPISGTIAVSNFPASQAVTGTFWQATQPVSGTVAVSNFPATQPISGAVSVSGSVAVTGAFFQATQPVSIATMPTTPVTGTFWQATQPVSGPLTDTQLRASAVPVSAASLPLPTGASTEATLANQNGSVAPGAAATKSVLVGAVYTAAGITLTNGQQAALQVDVDGCLRINLADVAGAAISVTNPAPVRLGDGVGYFDSMTIGSDRYMGVSIQQDLHQLVGNSSVANLASGATFTGTTELTKGSQSILVSLIADQTVTIHVQQSSDGTNWDIDDSFPVAPNVGYGHPFQVVGAYVRITVTNTGASSTTLLRLFCQLCPIDSALPRALSQAGNLKVALSEGSDKATYSAAVVNLSPAATATDILTIIGSATKVVKVTMVRISATQATSGQVDFILAKRSTANTGGTSTLPAIAPLDSNNPAATAVVRSYTANPTALGTLVGNVMAASVPVIATNSTATSDRVLFESIRPTQPIVLRGVAQTLAVNLNGVTVGTGAITAFIEWTEE